MRPPPLRLASSLLRPHLQHARPPSLFYTTSADPDSHRLLIVYHTMTNGTKQMAQAAYEAATASASAPESSESSDPSSPSSSVQVTLQKASQTTPDDILNSTAYIFATPENLASMAGMMKDLFDRTYYPCLGHLNGRPYAALICAGSDGEGAMRQLERICLGWRLKKVTESTIVITHAQDYESCHKLKVVPEDELERCREVAVGLVEGLKLGMF